MDYDSEVEDEARDFLIENEEMIVKALYEDADWDYNDIDDLDCYWHETIVDRGYSIEDAAYILDNCHEEETDSGIWEGLDARDAMSARAAYSYSNDVWFKCEEFYNGIKERMQEMLDDGDVQEEQEAQAAFDEFKSEYDKTVLPVEKDSEEELSLIRQWLRMNADAGMCGGYPVGGSYIDSCCGTGHGMPDVKDYVDFDHEFAKKVPWLSGKYKEVVQTRHDEMVNAKRTFSNVNYSVLNNGTAKQFILNLVKNINCDERLKLSDMREIVDELNRKVW
jgi:hypothetical protein